MAINDRALKVDESVPKYFTGIISFHSHNNHLRLELLLFYFSEEDKLRHREAKWPAQGHTASKTWSSDSNTSHVIQSPCSWPRIFSHKSTTSFRQSQHKRSEASWLHSRQTPPQQWPRPPSVGLYSQCKVMTVHLRVLFVKIPQLTTSPPSKKYESTSLLKSTIMSLF